MGKYTIPFQKREVTTAILVDGAFYRKRANHYLGKVSPEERADELAELCHKMLFDKYEKRNLYRIFYYDCPPLDKVIFDPISNKSINLGKSDDYKWMVSFLDELKHHRKFALRLGRLSENTIEYNLKYEVLKKLLKGSMQVSDIQKSDLTLNIEQKGVDMRIGIDISSLAYKKQVDQIILISGDSDFVPAAKQARREGIDFLLNPLGAPIKKDLFEHIDGLIKTIPSKKISST
ncbi:MAG: NYN domain-containing protein [Oscillospiraceae bacterium]|nr:NYN domain-containing protein [Oscillospiraceae bacterium]